MKVKLVFAMLSVIFFNYSYSQDLEYLDLKEIKLEDIEIEKTNLYDSSLSTFIYKYKLCFINQKGEKIIIKKTAGNIGYNSKHQINGTIDAIHFSPKLDIHSGFGDDYVESVVVGYVFDFKLIKKNSEVKTSENGIYEDSLIKINEIYYFIESIGFIESNHW